MAEALSPRNRENRSATKNVEKTKNTKIGKRKRVQNRCKTRLKGPKPTSNNKAKQISEVKSKQEDVKKNVHSITD